MFGDVPWVEIARRYVGVREVPGPATSATIALWLHRLKAWWRDDETPWCGVFVAACLDEAGLKICPKWYRAQAWRDWGIGLAAPIPGCVVVFSRAGGGHVGFVVGRDAAGNLVVLGGNQGDRVSVAKFSRDRVLCYRWPGDVALPAYFSLPVLSDAEFSAKEA